MIVHMKDLNLTFLFFSLLGREWQSVFWRQGRGQGRIVDVAVEGDKETRWKQAAAGDFCVHVGGAEVVGVDWLRMRM
jgi:hypothetical protein